MELLTNYPVTLTATQIENAVQNAREKALKMHTPEYLKLAFSLIDLTTLNSTDTIERGTLFANHVNQFQLHYQDMPNVAAICVYPPLVKQVAQTLKNKSIGIASVAAGFPSSQTFIEVKTLESRMAVENGASEIDIVISLGTWFSGDYLTVFNEIKAIKAAIGSAHLKVILETGALSSIEHIWNASIIAMLAGADFIKTSTGKMDPAATPEAAYIMCEAIKDFYKKTGKMVGLKPAGGMVNSPDALVYLAIVETVLGHDWMNNKWFRLGASRLANNLVSDILAIETGKRIEVKYF